MNNSFIFLGGDKRIIYAARAIGKRFETAAAGLSDEFAAPMGKYGFIVLPLPFTRDGKSINAPLSQTALGFDLITKYAADNAMVFSGGNSPMLEKICRDGKLWQTDYFAVESLTLKNAALTAEGAVSMLIAATEYSLMGANAVITGYGRIAKYTARLLRAFGARVTIVARNSQQRAAARIDLCETARLECLGETVSSADIIINTVPAELFSARDFEKIRRGAVYMELATRSTRPEVDFAAAGGIKYMDASGLPGKISPQTAGEAIAEAIFAAMDQ